MLVATHATTDNTAFRQRLLRVAAPPRAFETSKMISMQLWRVATLAVITALFRSYGPEMKGWPVED